MIKPIRLSTRPKIGSDAIKSYLQNKIEGEKFYNEQYVQLQELKSVQQPGQTCATCCPRWSPDSALSDLLTKFHEARQQWVTLTNDYSLTSLTLPACNP